MRKQPPLIFDGRPEPLLPKVAEAMVRGIALESTWRSGISAPFLTEFLTGDLTTEISNIFDLNSDYRLIITSSRAEAVNTGIKGVAWAASEDRRNIVVVKGDPEGFNESALWLERYGFCANYLEMTAEGNLDYTILNEKINSQTALVSLSSITPELFSPRNIQAISDRCREVGSALIVDFSMQCQYENIQHDLPYADAFIIDGTALDGPMGTGIFAIRDNTRFGSLISGGASQEGLRGGEISVSLMMGLKASLIGYTNRRNRRRENYPELAAACRYEVKNLLPYGVIPADKDSLPHGLTIILPGLEGEAVVTALLTKGVFISTGSSCLSAIGKPSPVLTGIGYSPQEASGSLHLTFRDDHSPADVKLVVKKISRAAERLRKISFKRH